MNGEIAPRGRRNGDGSIDVWVRGRRLHFPGGGRAPAVSDEAQPAADAGDVPPEVLIDVGNVVTMVSHDGWYARVGAEDVAVNSTKARVAAGPRLFGPRRRG